MPECPSQKQGRDGAAKKHCTVGTKFFSRLQYTFTEIFFCLLRGFKGFLPVLADPHPSGSTATKKPGQKTELHKHMICFISCQKEHFLLLNSMTIKKLNTFFMTVCLSGLRDPHDTASPPELFKTDY
jgi:hypothetical protein